MKQRSRINATALLRMNRPRYSLNCPAAALALGRDGRQALGEALPAARTAAVRLSRASAARLLLSRARLAPLPSQGFATTRARLVSSCRRRLLAAGVIADIAYATSARAEL
jgi:hypothetical protein